MDLREKVKQLPQQSGVYIMYNADGEVIYVGKAIKLKNRVKTYFSTPQTQTEKVRKLMENVVDFRYIITNNEIEALLLENTLIKKYTPKYNILLKDDKQYPFIRIDLNSKYPKL
ncbi:MAG: GIY-YIG nuclease family protein [Clostridia bacterium]|nr:GIY-YIG nuclease family protein [Clostridia bacterium]